MLPLSRDAQKRVSARVRTHVFVTQQGGAVQEPRRVMDFEEISAAKIVNFESWGIYRENESRNFESRTFLVNFESRNFGRFREKCDFGKFSKSGISKISIIPK